MSDITRDNCLLNLVRTQYVISKYMISTGDSRDGSATGSNNGKGGAGGNGGGGKIYIFMLAFITK